MVVLIESIWMLFMLFGYGGHDARKWKATLMER